MALRLESCKQSFSSLGGLPLFKEIILSMSLRRKMKEALPRRQIKKGVDPFDKFCAMVMGFISGAECIDDMNRLAEDPLFAEICNVSAATTYGRFLREFNLPELRKLQECLIETSMKLRFKLFKDDPDFILDIDSTTHKQCGQKIEGVDYHHIHGLSLESLQAFDSYGFQYWMEVREGATYTANGASHPITQVFRKVPKGKRRILRADSGYCNVDVFNACFGAGAKFVIAMRENMYEPLVKRVTSWKRNTKIRFRDGRVAEVASSVYQSERGHQALRVMIARAPKAQPELFERYDYFALITNFGHHEMRDEQLSDLYDGRGNAENFIRELKNGFDFKHFPSMKLLANRAYGLIGAFAYTMMRYSTYILSKTKRHFSKMIRFRMVYLACQVVKKARYVIVRLSKPQHEEVTRWLKQINIHMQMEAG